MLARVISGAVLGVDAYRVDVEADVARALPSFAVVGLPDNAVKESKDRVRAAVRNSGYRFPPHRITVNLAPADVRKEGAAFDLPVALAVLATDPDLGLPALDDVLFLGELSLDGTIRPVRGVLPIALDSVRRGVRRLCVPRQNVVEAGCVPGAVVLPAESLGQVVEGLCGGRLVPERVDAARWFRGGADHDVDLSEVRGQGRARRALEIAAAGGHNLLMVGPPGSGKTMLARRLPTILPPMSWDESLETSRIYSASGLTDGDNPLVLRRPFRAPHHTISDAGLIGGGSIPRCGEISLAHNGVLFLDELAEFKKHVLEVMRQPLEDGAVTIARAASRVTFPARFMVVGAMNPCPCGFFGDGHHPCTCGPSSLRKYRNRVSGPLLDRFDLKVDVPAVSYREIAEGGAESSATVRARVEAARTRQDERFEGLPFHANAHMPAAAISIHASPEPEARPVLAQAVDRLGLSARAYTRALKVARTIADLAGVRTVGRSHVLEALGFRHSLTSEGGDPWGGVGRVR